MKTPCLRITCLLLCLSLCLGLAACAPADERAFERACALMDAGDYEAAIEAFSAIGLYRDIAEKIDEAQALLDEENAEFLYGSWVNIPTGAVFTFSKGGTGTVAVNAQEEAITYTSDGKTVEITAPVLLRLKSVKEDGVLHLVDQEGLYDLVSQEDYAKIGPMTVEITLDNWQEYFEARQAQDVGVDDQGNVNHRELGYGIFLKEEYVSRRDPSTGDGEIWFDFTYSYTPYLLTGDLQSDSYSLEPDRMFKGQDLYRGRFSASLPVYDRGYQLWRSPDSDFNNAFCAFIGVEVVQMDGKTYIMMIDNVEITDARGSMVLLPE